MIKSVFIAIFALATASHVIAVPFSFSFTASNLGGPISTISGSFSGSYTPIGGFGQNPATLDSIELSIGGYLYTTSTTLLDVYSGLLNPIPFAGGYRMFSISGVLNGTGASGHTNDFRLAFTVYDDGAIYPWIFYYATPSSPLFFDEDANIGSYKIVDHSPSVPDSPHTLGLLISAMATLGLLSQFRKSR